LQFLNHIQKYLLVAVSQLAGRGLFFQNLAPTPNEGNPISSRRASAQFRGASLLGDSFEIETDRPPDFFFSTYDLEIDRPASLSHFYVTQTLTVAEFPIDELDLNILF
jgi:hypothetical protein